MKPSLLMFAALALLSACVERDRDDPYADCCAVCDVGKACGDSCIAREETCYEGAGCACNRISGGGGGDGDGDAPPDGPPPEECCPEDLPEGCWYVYCDCERADVSCVI